MCTVGRIDSDSDLSNRPINYKEEEEEGEEGEQ